MADCCGTTIALIVVLTGVFLFLLKKYMSGGVYRGIETMAGKTVVITGANTGIGKETVKELAMRGARVIMGCRNMEKGDKACQEIISLTKSKNVENRKLDLSSFESIREFAKGVLKTESRIDVLINNAGVMMCPKSLTKDGLEMQIGTNHFGHFLLTSLLLDKIKESAPSRIVIVSSSAHDWFGKMNFDDLNSEKSYSTTGAYGQSKLANLLHMVELSKRLKGTGVTVNSLHPGSVTTDLQRHALGESHTSPLQLLVAPLFYFLNKTPKQGAQTTLRLAIDPKLDNVSGKYFSDCEVKKEAERAKDEGHAKKLWEISESITAEKKP